MPCEFSKPPVAFSLPYQGARLESALQVTGWSRNHCAHQMSLDEGALRETLKGRRFIPDVIGIWIESPAQFHLAFSKPLDWADNPARCADNENEVDTFMLDNKRR